MAKKEITMAMVEEHNTPKDLWVVIENKVYDLSDFRREHPGGEEPLDEVAGKNATKEFLDVGHSGEAREMMAKYYVGDLVTKDQKKKGIGIAIGAVFIGVAAVFLIRNLIRN